MTAAAEDRRGTVPSVTVLIAAYNAEQFLRRAVASAQQQTIPVKEILIVDDASTDGTVAVVRELAKNDSRIRLVALADNGGPSAARNAGLDAATGEWIAVLDADDAFQPERLQHMLVCADQVQADIVVDSFRYYRADRGTAGPSVLDDSVPDSLVTFDEFLARARPYMPDTDWGLLKPIFKRAFLEEHHLRYPLKTRHGEDFLFLSEAFLHGARYAVCRHAGYLYTSWSGASSDLSRTVRDYRQMYRHTRELLRDERIYSNPLLARRVRQRAAAVKRLAAETDLARFRHNHDYNSIARRVLADNTFRMILAKRFVRRLFN
jgi:succinoglycan biosynthesis protein ExoO